MRRRPAASTWAALSSPTGEGAEAFDIETIATLPPPARRMLERALPEGSPLTATIELEMGGEIKLGSRWMPFTAEQILRAGVGFVWRPVVGGRILRFVGADSLGPDDAPDHARMEFRLHGLIPVARASGPDTARSARGRMAAETVAWLPPALTPQRGAKWTELDDERATVTLDCAGESVEVTVTVDESGQVTSLGLQRWNDGADPPDFEPFGGVVTRELVTPGGTRIAGAGAVGWGWDTPRWPDGEFFRYEVTAVR